MVSLELLLVVAIGGILVVADDANQQRGYSKRQLPLPTQFQSPIPNIGGIHIDLGDPTNTAPHLHIQGIDAHLHPTRDGHLHPENAHEINRGQEQPQPHQIAIDTEPPYPNQHPQEYPQSLPHVDYAPPFANVDYQSNTQLVGPKARAERDIEEAWNSFKLSFNKIYATPEEEQYRREIFIENTNKIFRMNDDYAKGFASYAQKINGFADMLHHEFDLALNGYNRSRHNATVPQDRSSAYIASANVQVPDAVDWRKMGAVTPVRNQGMCAGCYAFSAAGALEGQYFRKTRTLSVLSPQNLIDCTVPHGNDGCMGGLMDPAFQYVKENRGIDTDPTYPYEATANACRYRPDGIGADSTGFVVIPEGDEEALKAAVGTVGPVSAAIDASRETLQFYSNGVYFDGGCKNRTEDMNHAILIVGYDTEPDGKEFWWIKNSYGAEWGIGGYLKLARNSGNHCGIANIASYPLV